MKQVEEYRRSRLRPKRCFRVWHCWDSCRVRRFEGRDLVKAADSTKFKWRGNFIFVNKNLPSLQEPSRRSSSNLFPPSSDQQPDKFTFSLRDVFFVFRFSSSALPSRPTHADARREWQVSGGVHETFSELHMLVSYRWSVILVDL